MNHSGINKIFASLMFLFSLVIYIMTLAPTVSFWDCGEFIACSYRLQVPHPPGAPLYLLVGRIFTFIPEFLVENVALRVNLISALSSAFTVLFLYLVTVHLIKEYLRSDEGFLKYVPFIGGVIGSLTFAFTESFWFNAVEAEVYAPSMFFTGLVVWLIFYWSERNEQIGNEKYILLISYVIGLAIGVHLLNVLALPTVLMVIYYRRFEVNLTSFMLLGVVGVALTLLIYPGLVKGIPTLASWVGFGGLLVAIIGVILIFFAWAVNNRQQVIALLGMSTLLIVIGYSSYLMIYVRSNLDPNIDENDPETITEFISYMNREQYGDHTFDRKRRWKESPNGKKYASSSDFFWNYQVNHMYVRYFLWNFLGLADDHVNYDPLKLWMIPLLLGLIGGYYHFARDWKHGLAIFVLFFMTGLAIILYLNQPDPQPRERDYSYVGSFFAFSIWIGIGAAAVVEWIANQSQKLGGVASNSLPWLMSLLLLMVGPMKVLGENYYRHDRTGNYVAWDYSYNMLVSCDDEGIMFTNGDNDTFPLWYLQEVEYIRPDVRVANLSLLNTSWYIEQLKHKDPKVPMTLSDDQIKNINLKLWPKKQRFEVPVIPAQIRKSEADRYRVVLDQDSASIIPAKMSFEVNPKFFIPTRDGERVGALRVQDLMVLNILTANQFQKPMYFAVTTSTQNQLDGLQDYMRMDGLLFRITTIPKWNIDPDILYNNLMNKFRYRNLNDPDVFYNDNIIGLLQNYRSAFFRLSTYYLTNDNRERFDEVIRKCWEVMPPEVIPFTNKQFEQVLTGFAYMADIYPLDSLTIDKYSLYDIRGFGEVAVEYKDYEMGKKAFELFSEVVSEDPNSQDVIDYLKAIYRQSNIPDSQLPMLLENTLDRVKRQLVKAYRGLEEYDSAIDLLEKWQSSTPNSNYIKKQLEEIYQLRDEKISG